MLAAITGEGKSPAVHSILDSEPHSDLLPMQGVHPVHGELLWLLDKAAASTLS